MIHFSMAFLTGVLIQLSLAVLLSWQWLGLLLFLVILLYFYNCRYRLVALGVVLGLLQVNLVGTGLLQNLLPKPLENKNIVVTGKIVSPPFTDAKKTQFDFFINHIQHYGDYAAKVKLNWYYKKHPIELIPNQPYTFTVKLKRPNGFHNKNSFDYQTWLFVNHYAATGYIKKIHKKALKSSTPWLEKLKYSCYVSVSCIRYQWIKTMQRVLADSPHQGIILALVFGVKKAITLEQQQIMQQSGTSHLLAISGLHIGIIAFIFYALAKWLWRKSLWLQNKTVLPLFALSVAFVASLFYAFIAGFSLPTQRAIFMVLALLLSRLWYRHTSLWSSYFLALLLVLIVSPLSPLTTGFWLSFSAVGIIIVAVSWAKSKNLKPFATAVLIQIAIVTLLAPLIMVNFHAVSINSVLANSIAIPVVSFIILPLSFALLVFSLIFTPIANTLTWLLDHLLQAYFTMLSWLNEVISYQWVSDTELNNSQLLVLILVFWLLIKWKKFIAWLFLSVLITFSYFQQSPASKFKMVVFDVGQGLAVLVQSQNKTLLYDTGPAFSDKFTSVKSIILPYLKRHNITQLDKLVLSHSDKDHIGDYRTLLKKIKVVTVETGQVAFFNQNFKNCHQVKPWVWNRVKFTYLSAPINKLSDNNASCVLKITHNKSVLITGDIEKSQEMALVKKYAHLLQSDILIVPHHGSKTSSTRHFLKAVKPVVAISSNGYLNRFKHPAKKVVKRYQDLHIRFMTTAKYGAITINPVKKQQNRLSVAQGVDVQSDKLQYFNKWYQGLDQ